ncbi:MAG TPA: hypothetical protein EYO73_01435 [Sulfurimonas sp.]|nr:hypothetical protein [Sulfurimonas sp.]
MNELNPHTLKKLLISLGLSIAIIIIFLLLRIFLLEDKVLETKSFTQNKTIPVSTTKEDSEQKEDKKIMLLPKEDLQ